MVPNLANMTKELSKANNGASQQPTWNYYVIKYVLDIRTFDSRLNPWGVPSNPGKSSALAIAILQETQ